jgi:hypothetical protein
MAFVNVTVDVSELAGVSIRDTGTVGIVGVGTSAMTEALLVGSPAEVDALYATDCDLSLAAKLAFQNGAAKVWIVDIGDTKTTTTVGTGLGLLAEKDIQVVVVANTVETDTDAYVSEELLDHVNAAVTERIGVFMLDSGEDASTAPSAVTGLLTASEDRVFGIAHNSDNDVAAAVAGLIVSINPWQSPILRGISGITQTAEFTTAQRTALVAAQLNPVIDPLYLAGSGLALESAYTMGAVADGIYFLDVRRTIDDIVYKLKANLTSPTVIGGLQINRVGMASLINKISGILQVAVNAGEFESFAISVPVANALAKDAASRSAAEETLITTARTTRNVDVSISVEYAGSIHSIDVDLKFTA